MLYEPYLSWYPIYLIIQCPEMLLQNGTDNLRISCQCLSTWVSLVCLSIVWAYRDLCNRFITPMNTMVCNTFSLIILEISAVIKQIHKLNLWEVTNYCEFDLFTTKKKMYVKYEYSPLFCLFALNWTQNCYHELFHPYIIPI